MSKENQESIDQNRKDTEMQAIGRAHRLGQTSEINVYRFIIEDSIESEIFYENIKMDEIEIKRTNNDNNKNTQIVLTK